MGSGVLVKCPYSRTSWNTASRLLLVSWFADSPGPVWGVTRRLLLTYILAPKWLQHRETLSVKMACSFYRSICSRRNIQSPCWRRKIRHLRDHSMGLFRCLDLFVPPQIRSKTDSENNLNVTSHTCALCLISLSLAPRVSLSFLSGGAVFHRLPVRAKSFAPWSYSWPEMTWTIAQKSE